MLDIGLPGLDGLQAARQILDRLPATKVLFVTQQLLPDLIQAALATGAVGYLPKMDTACELLNAVAVVLGGGTYIGRRVVEFANEPPVVEPVAYTSERLFVRAAGALDSATANMMRCRELEIKQVQRLAVKNDRVSDC